ncbi:protein-disulfide reductase DsbD domain-containing protein [Microvirga terricola]|uniref:Thiol:disulfide interchange protein DsbD N-terminal domain-containing protein n=1 Tax=Microvirga terricola TaxID=2719797 RepID=A0ABX0VA24_9HYPH|nr:protein-disulfide reductase DsbD domain-containing protein [Microvirga terricola]NIX76690.1 hypothetical protein [Microvirga terricola]
MATLLRVVPIITFLILFPFAAFAQPESAPAWAVGLHSRVRLISGGVNDTGEALAGIEIALDPGFKTYWRTPGESGLPPRFDWSGSENVADVEIRWPAPSLFEDAGGVAYGYSHDIILPVVVKASQPGKPLKLALTVDYGICKDICIPARAELAATLSGAEQRAVIEQALAKVPNSQPLGAPGEVSLVSIEPKSGSQAAFSVLARAPAGSQPVLFAEGPENWYFSTSKTDDPSRFIVTIEEKPQNATGPTTLRLTLVAGERAVETEVSLDEILKPR